MYEISPVPRIPEAYKVQVDRIVETIIYLYTESRRLTKEQAARHGLTGPQLSVAKILEDIGDLSLSELSERINAQNSTVTAALTHDELMQLLALLDKLATFVRTQVAGKDARASAAK